MPGRRVHCGGRACTERTESRMITWMPYIAPGASAHALTDDELYDQIIISDEILRLLLGPRPPNQMTNEQFLATSMWGQFQWRLAIHGMMMANEYMGVRHNSIVDGETELLSRTGIDIEKNNEGGEDLLEPPWIGDLYVHRSHRSQLIMADKKRAKLWPGTDPRMPVLWPQLVSNAPRGYRLRIS